jgi:hypothetical protein
MPRFNVKYFFLQTGMEGRPDERDYGIVEAESEEEAIYRVAWREFPTDATARRYFRECLYALEVGKDDPDSPA